MENNFLLIIDGSSLLSTQFYGNLPREILFAKTQEEKEKYYYKIMQNSKGVYTNAVYGFFRTLLRIIKDQKPSHLVVTWDISRETFRRKLYPEYKAQRSETMIPLKEQFELCQKALNAVGVCQLMDENYEADDFSGTVAALFEKEIPVRILTKDNDYLQLITEQTHLWLMHSTAKKTEELFAKYKLDPKTVKCPERTFEFDPELVRKEFGIRPLSVPDLKALQGDSSDNIKGVPGVGEKAAAALIAKYETIENLYAAIRDADEAKKKEINLEWKQNLGLSRSPMAYLLKEDESELVGERAAVLSKQLATIKRDVPLEKKTLADYAVQIDIDAAKKLFHELEFKSLLSELPDNEKKEEQKTAYRWIADLAEAEEYFRVMTEKKKENVPYAFSEVVDEGGLFGYAFAESVEEVVFLRASGFLSEVFLEDRMKRLFDTGRNVIAFDIKKSKLMCENLKSKQCFDVAIAAYLIDPLRGEYPYNEVLMEYEETTSVVRNELPKDMSLTEVELLWTEKLVHFCCAEALAAIRLYPVLKRKIQELGMEHLFSEIEMPLLFTLYKMEQRGIKADKDALISFGKSLEAEIISLEKQIYEKAGEVFNINSPKQLGVVLFEKLHLKAPKKTKSGYSTSVDVLERLRDEAPIVDDVLNYRQLTKLKSTYADALAEAIAADGRIHCNFNQTITATGRLSCTNPNLQNIPVRTELGRSIRKVFVPEDGYVFVDADYSQIELRIMAAMSGDRNLIDAYRNKTDIHRLTASEVFHVPFDEVTAELRSSAKAVNFGIIYGISSFGLGQGLNISRKEAEEYIAKYFETYPVIKEFLDRMVEEGRNNGMVRTEYGRIRPIPEISSTNFMQRSFGERIAMNSPIQGTAADIMKIAMLRVEKRISDETKNSRLILQIHDELLVEAALDEKEAVVRILTEEMEAAANLEVPLEVEAKTGFSWYEAK